MKAVAYQTAHQLSDLNSQPSLALQDIELPKPSVGEHDLLVEVKAVSVNPVDTKIRKNVSADSGEYKVLGWDAAGVVVAKGTLVQGFEAGDKVWYAGDISRSGSNAQYQLVDARIASLCPKNLNFAEAAALPLTSLTAWELLFDRLQIPLHSLSHDGHLLIVGAAGGVGSIMVQLALALTEVKVIATASRPESEAWLRQLGAHYVLDHRKPLFAELTRQKLPPVDWVASLNNTDQHFSELVKCLKPQGKFGLIDDPQNLDIRELKRKSLSLHWEFMFTRPLFNTDDIQQQHGILQRVAHLVEEGQVQSTLAKTLGVINAANLKLAHEMIESQTTCGKLVLEGFA